MKIAIIGVGNLGSQAATHLRAAGHEVVGCDVVPLPQHLSDLGVDSAFDPAQASAGRDLVLVFVRDSDQAWDVIASGRSCVLEASPPPRLVVNCSTIAVDTAIRLGEACSEAGVPYLDAPVNGRVPFSVMFVGATQEHFALAQPALSSIAGELHLMGAVGAGTTAKLIHQLVLYSNVLVLQEALDLGVAAGLDRGQLINALGHSSARSRALEVVEEVSSRGLVTSDADLIAKDVHLVSDMALSLGIVNVDTERLRRAYEAAVSANGGSLPFVSVRDAHPGDGAEIGPALVRQFIKAWNRRDAELLMLTVDPSFTWMSINGDVQTLSEYLQRLDNSHLSSIEIEQLIHQDDYVMARLLIEYADGRAFRTHDVFRISANRIAEEFSGHA